MDDGCEAASVESNIKLHANRNGVVGVIEVAVSMIAEGLEGEAPAKEAG